MVPRVGWAGGVWLGALVFALSLVTATAADQPRTRWWLNADVQHQLRLKPKQVQALQRAFERDLPERMALRMELERSDQELQRLLERGEPDDALVERVSVQVETTRARRNVRRTLMLLEMYRILTPDQRLALSRLHVADPGTREPPPH